MMQIIDTLLPIVFAGLMGLAMLMYAILDGYDLGTGMLMRFANEKEQDLMIGSIGPFWDANETWLVLGVGLLLVAFPQANGLILTNLYLPVALMLVGLILRGVAFDFRAKAHSDYKSAWNMTFIAGSALTAFCQGIMLGSYILGFHTDWASLAFCVLVGLCVMAGYCLVGACWLIAKTEDVLQKKAVFWARCALMGTTAGIFLVSVATPLVSVRIFHDWFAFPNIIFLAPVPLITVALVAVLWRFLSILPQPNDRFAYFPFGITILIFVLSFGGLAYSFYPYIVPDQLTIQEAASSPEALRIMAFGAILVLPILVAYTFFCYRIFRGKAKDLAYD